MEVWVKDMAIKHDMSIIVDVQYNIYRYYYNRFKRMWPIIMVWKGSFAIAR